MVLAILDELVHLFAIGSNTLEHHTTRRILFDADLVITDLDNLLVDNRVELIGLELATNLAGLRRRDLDLDLRRRLLDFLGPGRRLQRPDLVRPREQRRRDLERLGPGLRLQRPDLVRPREQRRRDLDFLGPGLRLQRPDLVRPREQRDLAIIVLFKTTKKKELMST